MSVDGRVIDHVTWPKDDLSMRQLVEMFTKDSKVAQQGGVLCVVTEGYLGCDVMFHVSSEEIYWVFDIHRQKRLVVMDSRKKYLSIPVTYPLKMNVVDSAGRIQKYNGKTAVTVSEICEGLRYGDTFNTVMFVDDRQVSFNVGVNQGDSARLGRLDIVDTYEEKYLLVNQILDCDIIVGALAIPVYMPIDLAVAEKFEYSSDLEAFESWIESIGKLSASFPRQEVVTCQEIIMIDEKPEGGHYEYIKPSNALRVSEKTPASGSRRTEAASAANDDDSSDNRSSCRRSGYMEKRALQPLPRKPRTIARSLSEVPPVPPRSADLTGRSSSEGECSELPPLPPPRAPVIPPRINHHLVDWRRLSLPPSAQRRPPPAPPGDPCGADWSAPPPAPNRSMARVDEHITELEPRGWESATFPRQKPPSADENRRPLLVTYELTTPPGEEKNWTVTSPHRGRKKNKRNGTHNYVTTGSGAVGEWDESTNDPHHKQYATLTGRNLDKDEGAYGEHPYVVIRRQPTDDRTSSRLYPVQYTNPVDDEPEAAENGDLEEEDEEEEEAADYEVDWKQLPVEELSAGNTEKFDTRSFNDEFEMGGVVKLVGRVHLAS